MDRTKRTNTHTEYAVYWPEIDSVLDITRDLSTAERVAANSDPPGIVAYRTVAISDWSPVD